MWTIIRKELLDSITGLRFLFAMVFVVGLMGIGGYISSAKYAKEMEDCRNLEIRNMELIPELSNNLRRLGGGVTYDPLTGLEKHLTAVRPPSRLQFIAEGRESKLPNTATISREAVGTPQIYSRSNFLFGKFGYVDWLFLFGVVVSLLAVVFTYDAFSGERERGTLSLTLSNSLPRHTILLGKFAGAMLALCIPLFIGIVLNMLVVSFNPMFAFGSGDTVRICLIVCVSVMYISVFAFMGLFVSSRCSRSVTSLVILLVVWVISTVIIPQTGGMLARMLKPIQSQKEIDLLVDTAWDETLAEYRWQYGEDVGSFFGDPERDKWTILAQKTARERQEKIRRDYHRSKAAQAVYALNASRISPSAVFNKIGETLAGSGLGRYARWITLVDEYHEQFKRFVEGEESKAASDGRADISGMAVNPETVPVFLMRPEPVAKALADSFFDLLLLFLFDAVLFTLAYVSILRADVR